MTNSVTHAFVSTKADDVDPDAIKPSHWNGGHVLNITGDAGWITPTFQNGWVNYGGLYATAGYRKDGQGIVHLKGLVKDGALGATPVFTLPVGYRPAETHLFGVASNTTGGAGRVDVTSGGLVQALTPSVSSWVSLEGVIFLAEG